MARITGSFVDDGAASRSHDLIHRRLATSRLWKIPHTGALLAGSPLQPLLSMFVLALILTGIVVRSRTKKERDGIRAAIASVV